MEPNDCSPDLNMIIPFICGAIIVLVSFLAFCWWQSKKEKKERRDREWQRVPLNQGDVHEINDPALQVEIAQLNKLVNSLNKESGTLKTTCKNQQKELENLGVTSYIPTELTDPGESNIIVAKCIQLQLDRYRCNYNFTHINDNEELVNSSNEKIMIGGRNLKRYWGTSSTTPLPWFRCPQYFEVKARVEIKQALKSSDLLLEIGLARTEEQDLSHNIQGKPQTYSMNVAHCTTHNTICRNGWRHRREMQCLPQTMKNVAGHSAVLHFGVLYDHSRGRVVFLDVAKGKSVSVIDGVDNSAVLWPMFGVFYPQRGTVSMSLVVGTDINMSEEKKALLMKALHERFTEY